MRRKCGSSCTLVIKVIANDGDDDDEKCRKEKEKKIYAW